MWDACNIDATAGWCTGLSGDALDMPFVDYWKVEDGKVVEYEVVWDTAGITAQPGVMPG